MRKSNFFTLMIIFLLLPSSLCWAQGKLNEVTQKDLDALENNREIKARPIIKTPKKEVIGVDQELKIKYVNEETGIFYPTYSTSEDSTKYSVAYFLNTNLREIGGISTFELLYGHKFGNYWFELMGANSNLRYKSITITNGAVNYPDKTELNFIGENLIHFGAGISYRTTLIQNFIESGDYFETSSAHLTYNLLTETLSQDIFTGVGLKADFGIHKRFSRFFHIGVKFSYNVIAVKRPTLQGETDETLRSLMLHWLGVGIDLTYYL